MKLQALIKKIRTSYKYWHEIAEHANGKEPAYIDLMRTIRLGLVKYLNTARGLWDAMALSNDDLDGQYALDKEITALDNYERELTVRLIRAMRREEEKKNHE